MNTLQTAKKIKELCHERGLKEPIKNIDGHNTTDVYLSDILRKAELIIKLYDND